MTLMQWNIGARHWEKKVDDIRQLLLEEHPDILIITEANMFKGTEETSTILQWLQDNTTTNHRKTGIL